MSDLERRLEDLFMHDSRSRRVADVNVPSRRRSPLRGIAFAGATALTVLAVVVALSTLRGSEPTPLAPPSAPASPSAPAAVSASPDATASGATRSPAPTASATSAVRPDGRHGYFSQTRRNEPQPTLVLRTEQDPTPLAQLASATGPAVSPDGHRVAFLRTTDSGQQIMWGDATRLAEARVAVDLSGSGEVVTGSVVWAADNSNSIAFAVAKPSGQQGVEPPPAHSALRSVDLETGVVRELARTNNPWVLVPLIWHPRDGIAAGFETGAGGFAYSYVIVRAGQVERTVFGGSQGPLGLRADRDGARVLGLFGTSTDLHLRWWVWDRPEQSREMRAPPGEGVLRAAWRPGAQEIGVEILSTAPRQTPARGRFELWSVATDARRVVTADGGFEMFRHDGTAAIGVRGFGAPFETYLIDLTNGATIPIPRASDNESPLAPAVLF
jgi:hypothetical protein